MSKHSTIVRMAVLALALVAIPLLAASSAGAAGPMKLLKVEVNGPPSIFIPGWSYAQPDPGGTATFTAPYGNVTYSFPVPSRIDAEGTTFDMSISGTGTNIAPAMVSTGSLVQGNRVDLGTHWLADANGNATGGTVTAPVTLKPATFGEGSFQVNLGFSPTFTYTFEAVNCGREFAGRSGRADTSSSGSRAGRAGNSVKVSAVTQEVLVHIAGCDPELWIPVTKGMVLQQGDEISTDPDGSVTLDFGNGTYAVVKNTTQLKIASFFTEGGIERILFQLKRGELLSNVKTGLALPGISWQIATDGGVGTTRGTVFTTFYDPGSKTMLLSTKEGSVEVDPKGAGLRTVLVGAGKEVEVGQRSMSAVVRTGQAGARGGLNRVAALRRVTAVLARVNKACGISTPFANPFAVKPIVNGWSVTAKVVGRTVGPSTWTVVRGKLTATNALAKTLNASCPRPRR